MWFAASFLEFAGVFSFSFPSLSFLWCFLFGCFQPCWFWQIFFPSFGFRRALYVAWVCFAWFYFLLEPLFFGIVLHFVALYRPGECWHLNMPSFVRGRYTGQRAGDKMNGLWCQALAIMVRTKADTFSEGSTRYLAESTRSGIEIRRWADRLIWTTWRTCPTMGGPLFAHPESGKAWTTSEFMTSLVRPCWESLRRTDPPCESAGFLKSADPSLLQSRSFRRGGFQAMRRAKVDKTVRDYMMRWTELKSSNTNQESYDDLTAEDTVRATSSI